MDQEWQTFLQEAERLSLRLQTLEPLSLSYASPPFERNALRAEGITNYPFDWRRGNLAVFRSTISEASLPPPGLQLCAEWAEVILDGVRIRVRADVSEGFENPALEPIVAGDILPSVSARDSRRSRVEVWTSGNRVFRCKGKSTLLLILQAMKQGTSAITELSHKLGRRLTPVEERQVRATLNRLDDLVRTERREIFLYGS
jgi:hypothetical protein